MKNRPHDSLAYGLMRAVQHGTAEEILAALAAKPDLTWPDSEGMTSLHHAAADNKLETARLLIEAGAPVDAASNNGRTPLTLAAERGHLDMAKLLIAAGGGTREDETALHRAAEQRQHDMVRLLLDAGLAVDFLPMAGERPLALAAGANDTQIIAMLLDAGAAINARDMFNRTALHRAAARNAKEAARLLIGRGADESISDIYGQTPLRMAEEENHANMQLLLNKAPEIRADFKKAAEAEAALRNRRAQLALQKELTVLHDGTTQSLAVRKQPVKFRK